jgi:hypothetical protein
MGSINVRKVIVAGLVAGVVLLVIDVATGATLFSTPMEEALAARNLDMAALEGAVPVFLVTDLMYGLLTAFVYAAIRPRFGAGPMPGLLAGFVVWASSALNHVNFSAMGFLPTSLTAMMLTVWLVALLIAGYVAGRLYSE